MVFTHQNQNNMTTKFGLITLSIKYKERNNNVSVFMKIIIQSVVISSLFVRKFPMFWDTVEAELNTDSEDLCQAKSVFSCLGYLTKFSIALEME